MRFSKPLPIVALMTVTSCVSAANQPKAPASFDGERALEHVRQLVAIGPRVAGSDGAAKAREYIGRELKALNLAVEEQPFEARTPLGAVRMVNVRATLAGADSGRKRIIIGGHYDTKLFRQFTFVGANDGGSSTAFLLELARVLAKGPPEAASGAPIELLFLDGEEAVVEWQNDDHTYGSRHYVQAAANAGDLKNIGAFVLVDMVGDRDLRILRESQSTRWLTDILWSTARRLRRSEFVDGTTPVEDDHIEFLKAGVPAVDIIDLEYPAWHTADDTLDKLSAASLQAVAEVVLAALPEIGRRATERRQE